MNGTDYSNYYNEPKIYLPLNIEGNPISISVHASQEETKILVDKKLFRRSKSLIFSIPEESRLVLGDHDFSSFGWIGTYHTLSVYMGKEEQIWASYDFTENHGSTIPDTSGNNKSILNPEQRPLQLLYPFKIPKFSWFFFRKNAIDIFLNLFGFIPLTFIFTIGLGRKKISHKVIGIHTISVALSLSLIIETYQIWMPTRDSSLLDICLNTAGGGAGYLLALPILRDFQHHLID